jgi:protein-disulfide isomerase/uncharacterized membrane protein
VKVSEGLKKRLAVALGCALLGAVLSGILLMQHHGEPSAVQAVNEACGDGQTSGCEQVARSAWSSLLGVPWAAIGLAFSLILVTVCALGLAAPAEARAGLAGLALVLLGAALGVDLGLAGVQAFAVKAFCGLCAATYVLNAAAFAALWPARAALAGSLGRLSLPESRPLLGGLVLGALGFGAFTLAFDGALSARAAVRSATLLGAAPAATTAAPAAAPASGPAAAPAATSPAPAVVDHGDHTHPVSTLPPVPGGGPRNWEAEARRLQSILDDPHQLEVYFNDKAAREFAAARVEAVDLADAPSKGPAEAPVKVVEYSDFLCPFCRNLAGALSGFLPQAGGRVQIVYKHYPLDTACNPHMKRSAHDGACLLSLGGLCAQDQGKFWPYHDRVFARPLERAEMADVNRFAGEAGLDLGAFATCLAAPRTKERLAAHIAEAKRVGVESTPTLLVNGKKLPRINDFLQVVDKEAQSKGFPPMQSAANH